MIKPYRTNTTFGKLKAQKARLDRLHESNLPDNVKVYIRQAIGNLSNAITQMNFEMERAKAEK